MGATKNLVLGGSGTIGTALCSYLRSAGEEVMNLDLKTGFDLRTQSLEAYSGVDYVWFLAWQVGGSKFLTNPSHQYPILYDNAALCSQVFAFLERTKIPFTFTSSQLAAPDNSYGITKLLGERFTEALNGINVRFWNVYGWEMPGEKSHVITDMVLQALTKRKITLLTTGQEERQFIYMDDCVKNMVQIRQSKWNEPVHLTNGKWMKILDLAQLIAGIYDAEVIPGALAGYQNKLEPNASYLRFTWDTGIEEGIKKVAAQANEYIKNSKDVLKFT